MKTGERSSFLPVTRRCDRPRPCAERAVIWPSLPASSARGKHELCSRGAGTEKRVLPSGWLFFVVVSLDLAPSSPGAGLERGLDAERLGKTERSAWSMGQ